MQKGMPDATAWGSSGAEQRLRKQEEYLIFFLKDKMGRICFPGFNMAIKTVEANGQKMVFQRPQK